MRVVFGKQLFVGSAVISLVLSVAKPIAFPNLKMSFAESKACAVSGTVKDEPPKDPNADRFGFGDWNVNAERAIWVQSNNWRAGPDGNKVIWIRPAGTTLMVTGKRLDAQSSELQASEDRGYPIGFTVINLQFPTPGCWEVVAKAGQEKLRLVAHVASARIH